MPWNLLLLPLLGGFWFVSIFYVSRFAAIQASRDRLFFYSATAGLGLAFGARSLIIAALSVHEFVNVPWFDIPFLELVNWFKSQFLPWPYSGTAVLACILGPFAAQALNLVMRRKRFGRWQITRDEKLKFRDSVNEKALLRAGDQFERMVTTWMQNADFVIISLKAGKVYVGIVKEAPPNIDGRCPWITIAPYLSGYRDSKTKEVTLDTSYVEIIDKFVSEPVGQDDDETAGKVCQDDFLRVIRTDDIESAGKFNAQIWNKFQDAKPRLARVYYYSTEFSE